MSTKKSHRMAELRKQQGTQPARKMSVMQALETAVLLFEQAGHTEEQIMQYVHLIHLGLIRDGSFTEEYVKLAAEAAETRRLLDEIPEDQLDAEDRKWERDRRKQEIDDAVARAAELSQAPVQVIRTDYGQ